MISVRTSLTAIGATFGNKTRQLAATTNITLRNTDKVAALNNGADGIAALLKGMIVIAGAIVALRTKPELATTSTPVTPTTDPVLAASTP